MTEQPAVEAAAEDSNVAVGVADIFDAEEDWGPVVTLHEAHETVKEEMIEAAHSAGEPVVAIAAPVEAAPLEVVAAESFPVVEPQIAIVPTPQKAAPVKHAGLRKTLMSGMMKHIVDQVISKNKMGAPAIVRTSGTSSEKKGKPEKRVVKEHTAEKPVVISQDAELKPGVPGAGAAEPQKSVDLQSMFEKALSSRPAA